MGRFEVFISPDEPVYGISVVSRLLDIPVWTLRTLDKEGVVKARRTGRKGRFYCLKDVKKLGYIHYLMEEKGVNLKGVKLILEKEKNI